VLELTQQNLYLAGITPTYPEKG